MSLKDLVNKMRGADNTVTFTQEEVDSQIAVAVSKALENTPSIDAPMNAEQLAKFMINCKKIDEGLLKIAIDEKYSYVKAMESVSVVAVELVESIQGDFIKMQSAGNVNHDKHVDNVKPIDKVKDVHSAVEYIVNTEKCSYEEALTVKGPEMFPEIFVNPDYVGRK